MHDLSRATSSSLLGEDPCEDESLRFRPFPCALSTGLADREKPGACLIYHSPNPDWTRDFWDFYRSSELILIRNAVFHKGDVFEVLSISTNAFESTRTSAVCVSRTVEILGRFCFDLSEAETIAFESESHLREIRSAAFTRCELKSIAVPASVHSFWPRCFAWCRSLRSVVFDPGSSLVTIDSEAFDCCALLTFFILPASVTAIHPRALDGNFRSIEIEEGSVSFRVCGEFFVDFDVRLLIFVIGSPESIVLPASIVELGGSGCSVRFRRRSVRFESNWNLRSIGACAFARCGRLESIHIPDSVEVIHTGCFQFCFCLRTVTFGGESRLTSVESGAFHGSSSVRFVNAPPGVRMVS
jgi:hypothetical protein